jgi:cysteinyl-tRNA synthetase
MISGGARALAEAKSRFDAGMDDDLNVPQALSALFELRSALLAEGVEREIVPEVRAFLQRANDALGVLVLEEESLDARMQELIATYGDARKRKDWAESDRIRGEITALGVVIQDTPQGTVWRRKS